jgi:urease accessory protein
MTPAAALLLLADGRFPAGGHVHSAGVEAAVGDGRVTGVDDLRSFLVGRLHTNGLSDAALAAATAHRLVSGDPGHDDRALLVEAMRLLDAEAAARQPVPPLRAASRRLGRQLLRVAGRCWTHPVLDAASAAAAPPDQLPDPTPGGTGDGRADPSGLDGSSTASAADGRVVPSGPLDPAPAGGAVGRRMAGADRAEGLHHPVALGAVAVAAGLSAGDAAALAVHHVLSTPAQAAVRLLGLDPFAVVGLLAQLSSEAEAVARSATVLAEGSLDELPAGAGPLVEIAALDHEHWPIRMFAT